MPTLTRGTSQEYNLSLKRRETFQLTFTYTSNGTTPVNITGYSVYAEIRKKDSGVVYFDLQPAILVGTDGNITINTVIPESLKAGSYSWDMLLVSTDNVRTYIVSGDVRVDATYTDDNGDYTAPPSGANIQDLITSAYSRGIAKLPFGTSNITSTVVTQNKAGLVIEGHGSLWDFNPNLNGSHSKIIWATNNTTTPMIDCRGIHQYWRNFSLCGDDRNLQYGGKPTAGILVSDDAGLGPGKHVFEKFTIERCVAGIQAAEALNDSNCDVSTVNSGYWRNCQKAFYAKGAQTLDWVFHQGQWTQPDTSNGRTAVFHYEAAGSLTSHEFAVVSTTSCDVLRLSQIHSGGKIGHNASSFAFNGLKVDTLAAGTTLVNVDQTATYCDFMPAMVSFTDCKISGLSASYAAENQSMAILGGGIKVFFYRNRFAIDTTGSVKWHTSNSDIADTEIWFVNCKLYGVSDALSLLNITDSDGSILLHVVGCGMPDYHGVISGDQ
jgi:hypothetical protein